MLKDIETLITTTNLVLARKLLTERFNDIEIYEERIKSKEIERVARFSVQFLSGMAIVQR